MGEDKQKILLLVEGAKTDVVLMKHLISIYQMDIHYEIVSYCTNIYTLYHEMFENNDPEEMDLLQLLKSRESNPSIRSLFDIAYSDILLIFDLDPQDALFSPEKIEQMAKYFVESSDMGKLYINYPMIESFYHMADIPDPDYNFYFATLDELLAGKYKARVNRENRNHDYRKFATDKAECNTVITQNLDKAWQLIRCTEHSNSLPSQMEILVAQLSTILNEQKVAVLNTCSFFIPEYNPKLIL